MEEEWQGEAKEAEKKDRREQRLDDCAEKGLHLPNVQVVPLIADSD